ncbi:MAG: hypothetical protein ACE5I5_12945 [Candidatus Heimdallarchaeota archaeon]
MKKNHPNNREEQKSIHQLRYLQAFQIDLQMIPQKLQVNHSFYRERNNQSAHRLQTWEFVFLYWFTFSTQFFSLIFKEMGDLKKSILVRSLFNLENILNIHSKSIFNVGSILNGYQRDN